jgi:hypothetical protein
VHFIRLKIWHLQFEMRKIQIWRLIFSNEKRQRALIRGQWADNDEDRADKSRRMVRKGGGKKIRKSPLASELMNKLSSGAKSPISRARNEWRKASNKKRRQTKRERGLFAG